MTLLSFTMISGVGLLLLFGVAGFGGLLVTEKGGFNKVLYATVLLILVSLIISLGILAVSIGKDLKKNYKRAFPPKERLR